MLKRKYKENFCNFALDKGYVLHFLIIFNSIPERFGNENLGLCAVSIPLLSCGGLAGGNYSRTHMKETENKYTVFTLPNGMRTVCWHTDGLVSYIGIVVNAGSRDESPSRHGLAHFVEHTIFKGTRSRKSWQVSSRMEVVGGELNAYTSKEETMVYTNAPAGYEERAVELLADIVSSSVFPQGEIEKEREVVIEEINSYLDSPSDSVYDEFEELAYAGSGLAHNILGDAASVRLLTGEDCRDFIDRHYTPSEMVAYCCSPLDPEKVRRLMERHFGCLCFPAAPRLRQAPPPMSPFNLRHDRGNHQANTIMGARVFGRKDPRRFALYLLNNYLGGPCMNSRLNRELREKRGYVYTVDSNVSLMSDCGLMMVYFGSDPATVEKCRRVVLDEIDRLAQSRMSDMAFEKVKRQYCGQLIVSSDHMENRAMALAKSILYYGEINDSSTTAEYIRSVTAEQLREVAALLPPSGFGTLSLV